MSRRLGRYSLQQRLRSGGMAEVFLGVLDGPGDFRRRVAVKVVQPCYAQDPEFQAMFKDEATIAAQLSHANIAQVHDFGIEEGVPYLVMEYIQGWDLGAIMERLGRQGRTMPWSLAAAVILEVAKGLYYVHNKREFSRPLMIVHRDISPHNIMISYAGEVKILDFGIAKAALSVAVTRAGQVKGKGAYMAPEQAMGHPVDARADLFSLGVVFWELLTGRRLFGDENEAATLRKLLTCNVPAPHSVNPELPRELAPILASCLAKDPKGRYNSLLQLYQDLSNLLFSRPGETLDRDLVGLLAELFPDEMMTFTDGEHPSGAGEARGTDDSTRRLAPPGLARPPGAQLAETNRFIPWDKAPKAPRPRRLGRVAADLSNRQLGFLFGGMAVLALGLLLLQVLLPGPAPQPAQEVTVAQGLPSQAPKELAPKDGNAPAPAEEPEEAIREAEAPGLQKLYRVLELLDWDPRRPPQPPPASDALAPESALAHPEVVADQRGAFDELWRRSPMVLPFREQGPVSGHGAGPRGAPGRRSPGPGPGTDEPVAQESTEGPSEARPADAKAFGTLLLSPDPFADMVFVDGKRLGKVEVPLRITLPVGTHRVKFERLNMVARCRVLVVEGEEAVCYRKMGGDSATE